MVLKSPCWVSRSLEGSLHMGFLCTCRHTAPGGPGRLRACVESGGGQHATEGSEWRPAPAGGPGHQPLFAGPRGSDGGPPSSAAARTVPRLPAYTPATARAWRGHHRSAAAAGRARGRCKPEALRTGTMSERPLSCRSPRGPRILARPSARSSSPSEWVKWNWGQPGAGGPHALEPLLLSVPTPHSLGLPAPLHHLLAPLQVPAPTAVLA